LQQTFATPEPASHRHEYRAHRCGERCCRNDRFYIATEGWLFLAVIDFFSRQVIGWSLRSDMTQELVIDARWMSIG
jgi:transposase InsO family protein